MTKSPEIPRNEVGERLRVAREAANVTQANAAAAIDVARTTIVAIENGQRRARIAELQKLARLYGVSVNAILRREAIHVDLEPQFRALPGSSDAATEKAVHLLSTLARAEVELENLLGIRKAKNYPSERPLLQGDVSIQAENDAAEFRSRLGFGNSPIRDVVGMLELELGVRVYVRELDSKIAGLFAFDDALGACILLNAAHSRERRAQTAAHETGHFVSNRRKADVLRNVEDQRSRGERYANTFGRALLTPARTVMEKFQEVTAGAAHLSRRHVIILAHFFGVSREAMVRRLEELRLAKAGSWDWFAANGGIPDSDVRQVLGDLVVPDLQKADAARPTTLRLHLLASEALRKELLSEGQMAQLLSVDRLQIRELLDQNARDGNAAVELAFS